MKTAGPADFKSVPGFENLKICGSNRAKQNIELFLPVLYDKEDQMADRHYGK